MALTQVTTIKDAAFGLGYHPRKTPAMAAAVVDLVASKPQHAGWRNFSPGVVRALYAAVTDGVFVLFIGNNTKLRCFRTNTPQMQRRHELLPRTQTRQRECWDERHGG